MSTEMISVRSGWGGNAPIINSYPLETLQGMSADEYKQLFDGKIQSAIDDDIYDTVRIVAGQTLAKKTVNMFSVPNGSDAKTADNGASVYTKDEGDTNMTEGNRMEWGNTFILDRLQVQLFQSDREFNAASLGKPSDLTAATTATTVSSPNIVFGLLDNISLSFRLGDRVKARGPLYKFPSEYVLSGAIGNHDSGFTQNGIGFSKPLEQIVVLRPGQHFNIDLSVLRSLVVPTNVQIKVFGSGVRLEPVS